MSFQLCDFCQVETTAPLLYIEVDGFNLDVCPLCYRSSFGGDPIHHSDGSPPGGEEE